MGTANSCLPEINRNGSPLVNRREELPLEEEILFFSLFVGIVITSLVIGRLWKENDGRLLIALAVIDIVLIIGLIAAREKASEGSFVKAEKVLREGTCWKVIWKDSSDGKRVEAILQNIQTQKRRAVTFKEDPPQEFTVGKVRGWFKWKRLELKPGQKGEQTK